MKTVQIVYVKGGEQKSEILSIKKFNYDVNLNIVERGFNIQDAEYCAAMELTSADDVLSIMIIKDSGCKNDTMWKR